MILDIKWTENCSGNPLVAIVLYLCSTWACLEFWKSLCLRYLLIQGMKDLRRMTHSIDQSEDQWSMAKISWIPVDPDTAESYFAFSLSLLFILLQSGRVLRSSSICFLYNFYKTSDMAAEPLNSLLNFSCFISSRSFKKAILTELSILSLTGFSTMHSTFKIHKIFIELFLG